MTTTTTTRTVWNETFKSTLLTVHSSVNTSSSSSDVWLRKFLLGCLLFTLSIFTVCGNLLVLYAIRTEKRLRTVSNLFIASLALADFIVGLVVMPLSAGNLLAGRWPFSYLICQMWLSVDYVASTASIFNLVLLSLDRYWAVVHPLLYLRSRTRRRATHFIVTVWFLSFLWAPAVIFWSSLVPEHSDVIKPNECDTAFRSNKIFKTLTALGNFYLPLLTMIVISCRIMVAIRSRSTMECGRRISSTTQKQMKQERLIRERSFLSHHDKDSHTRDRPTRHLSSPNDFDQSNIESIRRKKLPEIQSDDTTEFSFQLTPSQADENASLCRYRAPSTSTTTKKSHSIDVGRFSFSPLKPISVLFPSLSSIKEKNEKRQSEEFASQHRMPTETLGMNNVLNTSTELKSHEQPPSSSRQTSLRLTPLARTISTSSFAFDDYPQTIFINPFEHPPSLVRNTPSSHSGTEVVDLLPPPTNYLSVPSSVVGVGIVVEPTTMTIRTFFDYIVNPSLSSSLQKELKAARQLGMLVGMFTLSWLPYFILFLVVAWCQNCVSDTVYSASIWLGYLNSTFNPLIYPLCNVHFRRAFRKTFYCQHAKTKLPNISSLRELQTFNSIHQRR